MERSPKKSKDKDNNDIFGFIFQNAFGNPVILTVIPTASQMKANSWGVYGTTLYIKFANNVMLSFTGTLIS